MSTRHKLSLILIGAVITVAIFTTIIAASYWLAAYNQAGGVP